MANYPTNNNLTNHSTVFISLLFLILSNSLCLCCSNSSNHRSNTPLFLFEKYYKPLETAPTSNNHLDQANAASDFQSLQSLVNSMAERSIDLVINQLEERLESDALFEATSQWYLALAYLKAERPYDAHRILKNIVYRGGHPYADTSRQLIQDLENTQ